MALLDRIGVGIEAGLATIADAERLVSLPDRPPLFRVLIEIEEQDVNKPTRSPMALRRCWPTPGCPGRSCCTASMRPSGISCDARASGAGRRGSDWKTACQGRMGPCPAGMPIWSPRLWQYSRQTDGSADPSRRVSLRVAEAKLIPESADAGACPRYSVSILLMMTRRGAPSTRWHGWQGFGGYLRFRHWR